MAGGGSTDQSFWQFSDQLRLQTSSLAHLSIGGGDSIWNDAFLSKRRPDDRRNFDIGSLAPTTGGGGDSIWNDDAFLNKSRPDDRRNFDIGSLAPTTGGAAEIGKDQKHGMGLYSPFQTNTATNGNGNGNSNGNNGNSNPFGWKSGFKSSSLATNINNNNNNFSGGGGNGYFNKDVSKVVSRKNYNFNDDFGGKSVAGAKKKNSNSYSYSNNNNSNNNNNNNIGDNKATADKRFKTLPASEALPRSEAVGGYIFVCNNDTMPENLRRMLFGLPPRYRDSVRAITPGLPLFLYNYSTHQLHGIFQAASFGGTNIDPSAWEDKKCPGESRFPAQVRALTKKLYVPLEEDAFRPILHHYDGPKFRLELSVPEALALLDKFEESDAY